MRGQALINSGIHQERRGYAVAAGILGWTLDAFDFFVVVFLVDTLPKLVVGKSAIIQGLTPAVDHHLFPVIFVLTIAGS